MWLRAKWRLQICARVQDFNKLAFALRIGSILLTHWWPNAQKKLHMATVVLLWGGFASVMCWSRDASCEFPSRKEKETFDGTQQHAVNRPRRAHGRVSERERRARYIWQGKQHQQNKCARPAKLNLSAPLTWNPSFCEMKPLWAALFARVYI